jgi:hypothetical protein
MRFRNGRGGAAFSGRLQLSGLSLGHGTGGPDAVSAPDRGRDLPGIGTGIAGHTFRSDLRPVRLAHLGPGSGASGPGDPGNGNVVEATARADRRGAHDRRQARGRCVARGRARRRAVRPLHGVPACVAARLRWRTGGGRRDRGRVAGPDAAMAAADGGRLRRGAHRRVRAAGGRPPPGRSSRPGVPADRGGRADARGGMAVRRRLRRVVVGDLRQQTRPRCDRPGPAHDPGAVVRRRLARLRASVYGCSPRARTPHTWLTWGQCSPGRGGAAGGVHDGAATCVGRPCCRSRHSARAASRDVRLDGMRRGVDGGRGRHGPARLPRPAALSLHGRRPGGSPRGNRRRLRGGGACAGGPPAATPRLRGRHAPRGGAASGRCGCRVRHLRRLRLRLRAGSADGFR